MIVAGVLAVSQQAVLRAADRPAYAAPFDHSELAHDERHLRRRVIELAKGEKLLIGTWIVENDQRISITRRYQIVRESEGVTRLRRRTRCVCVALDSGKPRRMPPEFLAGYQPTAQE